MHRPSVWAGVLSILLLALIIAIRFLGDNLYAYPANLSPLHLPKDAAIICLAGGKFRIEAAFDLYAKGVGDRLLIIGAGKKSTAQSLAAVHAGNAAISPERFARIQVETESRNTIENAFAVRRYLQQNPGLKTIVLITSGYHLRRAQITIQNQIRPGVKIVPYVPDTEALKQGNWWHSLIGIQVTTVEYFKLMLASLLIPRLGYF